MKRILSIALALCVLVPCAAFFTGCSIENSKDWPVTYGDVTIDKEPENIVVLNDVFADIISCIGYDVKMVGRSVECNQEFLYVVPTVGTAAAPDAAAIANAETDLVIADSTLSAEAKNSIEESGAKVVTMQVPSNQEELKQLYIDLGTVLGGSTTGSEKGEKGYDDLLELLSTLNTATSNIVRSVAYLYMNENNELCTFVKDSLAFKFFNYNGNPNVLSNQQEPQVNTMELRVVSPTYIFYDSDAVLTYLASDENTVNLSAVAENRICQIPKQEFERFGTSAEEAIFKILDFIEKDSKATLDEADIEEAPAEAAQTPEAAEEAVPATEAAEETTAPAAQDDNVIEYSAQREAEEY